VSEAKASAPQGHLYRCNLGHEIRIESGQWFTMRLQLAGESKPADYNYCPHCFGAWAERQWPLTCEPLPAKP